MCRRTLGDNQQQGPQRFSAEVIIKTVHAILSLKRLCQATSNAITMKRWSTGGFGMPT